MESPLERDRGFQFVVGPFGNQGKRMALFSTLKKRWQCFQRRSAWKHTLPSNQFRSSPDRPEFASTLQLIQFVPAVRHLARFLAGSFPFTGISFMWFALRSWTQLPRAQAFAQMPWRATRIGIRSALLCAEESRGIHDARCSSCCWRAGPRAT